MQESFHIRHSPFAIRHSSRRVCQLFIQPNNHTKCGFVISHQSTANSLECSCDLRFSKPFAYATSHKAINYSANKE
jgi:hypothetical protein